MATYFISDIHGEYELFCKLLKKIKFSDSDTLIVLGDFLNKNKQPIKLIKFIKSMPNIKAISGNHEYYIIEYYQDLMWKFRERESILKKMQNYFPQDTEHISMDVIDYIKKNPFYIETQNFICVHAGVELDSTGKVIPMRKQNYKIFIFDRKFVSPNVIPVNSKTVLFGHTPCHYTNGTGRIIKTPRSGCNSNSRRMQDLAKVQLDTGVAHTKMLGILRFEDTEEFYVYKYE